MQFGVFFKVFDSVQSCIHFFWHHPDVLLVFVFSSLCLSPLVVCDKIESFSTTMNLVGYSPEGCCSCHQQRCSGRVGIYTQRFGKVFWSCPLWSLKICVQEICGATKDIIAAKQGIVDCYVRCSCWCSLIPPQRLVAIGAESWISVGQFIVVVIC